MSLKTFNKRQGRISHDLALYQFLSNSSLHVTSPPYTEEYVVGYSSGVDNTRKVLLRGIFNSNIGGNTINVKGKSFTLTYMGVAYHFPGGVISKLDMGCFPYETGVIVDVGGNIGQQYFYNVGRLDPSTFGDK